MNVYSYTEFKPIKNKLITKRIKHSPKYQCDSNAIVMHKNNNKRPSLILGIKKLPFGNFKLMLF